MKPPTRAFTVLEVTASLFILAVLAALVFVVSDKARAKAEEARCLSNMRAISTGIHSYMNENNRVWPQVPIYMSDKLQDSAWIMTLRPYVESDRVWKCPSGERKLRKNGFSDADLPLSYYTLTAFDALPGTAFKWSNMPWVIENGNFHGRGALVLFVDGSIRPFNEILAELTASGGQK